MGETPKGFELKHRLDGGGRTVRGEFDVRTWYGPLRRYRIKRAKRRGDLRGVFELVVLNVDDFDIDAWDGSHFRTIVPLLLEGKNL